MLVKVFKYFRKSLLTSSPPKKKSACAILSATSVVKWAVHATVDWERSTVCRGSLKGSTLTNHSGCCLNCLEFKFVKIKVKIMPPKGEKLTSRRTMRPASLSWWAKQVQPSAVVRIVPKRGHQQDFCGGNRPTASDSDIGSRAHSLESWVCWVSEVEDEDLSYMIDLELRNPELKLSCEDWASLARLVRKNGNKVGTWVPWILSSHFTYTWARAAHLRPYLSRRWAADIQLSNLDWACW